jgi:hypothetical protein
MITKLAQGDYQCDWIDEEGQCQEDPVYQIDDFYGEAKLCSEHLRRKGTGADGSMSCRAKTLHDLGECDCYFKPRDFLELLERERRLLGHVLLLMQRRADPETRQAIVLHLTVRADRLRN